MNQIKKLTIFLLIYAIVMRILWNHLTESTQVNEVILLLFAVSIVVFTLIIEMHKINQEDEEENENES